MPVISGNDVFELAADYAKDAKKQLPVDSGAWWQRRETVPTWARPCCQFCRLPMSEVEMLCMSSTAVQRGRRGCCATCMFGACQGETFWIINILAIRLEPKNHCGVVKGTVLFEVHSKRKRLG